MIKISILLVCIAMSASLARGECMWDEKKDLDERFQRFVVSKAPRECKPVEFGYMNLIPQIPSTLKFEIVVRADKGCVRKLKTKFASLKKSGELISCRGNSAYDVETYDADGGPTFMFVFRASEFELREAERYGSR